MTILLKLGKIIVMEKKCHKHPKYSGKKLPKYICFQCLKIYFTRHQRPRMPIIFTKVHKNKAKYDRKEKHSKNEEN